MYHFLINIRENKQMSKIARVKLRKDTDFNFRLPSELKTFLQITAKKEGMTAGSLLVLIIKEWMVNTCQNEEEK